MTLDNVLPIDAEAARLLARRTTRLRWFAAVLTSVWLAMLVPTLIFTPLPPLGLLLLLGALVILAEHRFILFGDETAMSGSILVVVTAVFALGASSAVALPIIVASLAGLYWRHVKQAQWMLIAVNAAALGIAAGVAALLSSQLTVSGAWSALLSATVCVCAYWYINSVLIGCAAAIRHGDDIARSVVDQATSECPVLILAIAAALLSMHLVGHGLVAVGVGISVVLFIFEFQIRSPGVRNRIGMRPYAIYIVALTSTLAVATEGRNAIALLLIGVYLVASSAFDRFALGVAFIIVAIAWSTAFAAEGAGLPSIVQLMIAAESTLIACAAHLLMQKRDSVKRLGSPALIGLAIPSAREMGSIIATAFAVQATLAMSSVLISGVIVVAGALATRTVSARLPHGEVDRPRTSLAS